MACFRYLKGCYRGVGGQELAHLWSGCRGQKACQWVEVEGIGTNISQPVLCALGPGGFPSSGNDQAEAKRHKDLGSL